MKSISLSSIKIDGGTQPRSEIDESIVAEYAAAMTSGDKFPPVVVFNDGVKYWLADGFHRIHAARRIDKKKVDAEVHDGTKRDAILYSVGANSTHGHRRSNEDKRKAVMTLLRDEEWSQWSDREIARHCAVHHDTVSSIRKSLAKSDSDTSSGRTYTNKHGSTSTMNTENIGKRRIPNPVEPVETKEPKQDRPKRRGEGLRYAHEAIKILHKIPLKDELRGEAFDTVIQWIKANR